MITHFPLCHHLYFKIFTSLCLKNPYAQNSDPAGNSQPTKPDTRTPGLSKLQFRMESGRSEKQIPIHTLKKDLNPVVTNVATGTSVPLHRGSIMQCNESSLLLQSSPIIDHQLANYQRDLGPFFLKLPQELRDQIYSDLITSGHPHFMIISRVMNAEGMALIFKRGVYRVNFHINKFREETDCYNCPQPTSKIVDNIQNLNIRIRWSHGNSNSDLPRITNAFSWLEGFKDSSIKRGKCTIAVEVYPLFNRNLLSTIAHSVGILKSFDTVALCIGDDPDYRRMIMAYFPRDRITITRLTDYIKMEALLKPHLGNGEMSSDGDGPTLVFRPLKSQQRNAGDFHQSIKTLLRNQMTRV